MILETTLFAAQALLSALQSLEFKKMPSMFDGQSELEDTVRAVIDMLRDVGGWEPRSRKAVELIRDLEGAVFEADDLVDEVLTLPKRKLPTRGISNKVSNFFSSSKNPLLLAYQIKNIRKRLDALVAKSIKSLHEPAEWERSRPETTLSISYVNKEEEEVDEIIGRQDDLDNIVRTLLAPNNNTNNDQRDDVSVLSIAGISGVGKTALAKLVFNHPLIKDAFPLRLWTSVSSPDPFSKTELIVKNILSKILPSNTRDNLDQGSSFDQLQNQLAGTKYLLVLDGILYSGNLRELMNCLTGAATGSWILTTSIGTQHATVAHKLQGLSEAESRSLFQRMAFASNTPDELVIGQKIVEGCRGVPLAIRVAGRLLYGQEPRKWQSVQDYVLAINSIYDDARIESILKLSYNHLESLLKHCLLCCALFPHDYAIEKEMLISLWLAQGYIVPRREHQSLEDAAEEYFTILLDRCFLQDVEHDAYGEIISCKLHTLILRLVQSSVGREMCQIPLDYNCYFANIGEKSRHLSIFETCNVNAVIRFSKIRSLLYFGGWDKDIKMEQSDLKALIKHCKCLRTLELSNLGIKSLPKSIGELLHLRYLNLSRNRDLKVLPKEITTLVNLQTLILNGCQGLTKLPEDLSKLANLRALDIKECSSLTCMPSGLGDLTSLHTLTEFVLGETSLKLDQRLDQLEDLKALQNLRGYLTVRIQSLENATYAKEVARSELSEGAYLSNKVLLNHIRFSFTGEEANGGGHEELMGVLQPHVKVKGLDLCGYNSVRMPGWITFLPNLVTLCLENCRKLQYLPYLGILVHLKVFHLVNLLNLEYIFEYNTASASGSNLAISAPTGLQTAGVASLFPSLQQFHLIDLPKLKGLFRPEVGLGVEDEHMLVSIDRHNKVLLQSLFDRELESSIVEGCPELESVSQGSRVEELSSCGVETSSTKESIDPATEITHGSNVIEEHEIDSSLPDLSLNINVHPPQKPALPPTVLADDAVASTQPVNVDLQSSYDVKIINDALLLCSLFPPEYEFEKTALLQLWLANGIFDEEPMEEIASLFFKYCLDKGYFEVSRTIFLTGEEMYTFKGHNCLVLKGSHVRRVEDIFNLKDLSPKVSHVCVSCRNLNDSGDLSQFESFKQLRTLIFLEGHFSSLKQVPRDFFLSLELLRTLDLSQTRLEELPSSIGNLKCLHYLDLTKTPIKHLPEALDCLENLQTLKLRGCSNISTLPEGMRKLEKLRHLDFDVLLQLRSMPEGMGALTNIRTLSAFIVGVDEENVGVKEGRGIRQLKNMNNISGSFCISGLENVLEKDQVEEAADLRHKSLVRKLELRWSDSKDKDGSGHAEVLSSLQPHGSLEELRISCYGGSQLPIWISNTTFCQLVNITLFKCENCSVLRPVGQLPALKSLNIVCIKKLEVIDHVFYGVGNPNFVAFPKLERLTIQDMPSLREWEKSMFYSFPELLSLTVQQCPELLNIRPLSSLRSLQTLEITHCGKFEPRLDKELPPSLKTFISEECPLITENAMTLKRNNHQNWLKLLEQIPNLWIDHQEMSGLNSSEEEEEEEESEKEEDESEDDESKDDESD